MEKSVFDSIIETDRLLLRKLTLKDLEDMYEYTSNPAVTTHLHWYAHTDIGQTRAYLENVVKRYETHPNEFPYGIELKSERKMIGVVKISNVCFFNKRGEFTSILNPAYQGKGYMGEAWQGLLDFCFNVVGLNRIQSYVTEENIPSQKKNIKAGLSYEGRLKDYWIMKGIFKDALVYAINAKTFKKLHNQKGN